MSPCTPVTLLPIASTALSSSFCRRPVIKTSAPSLTNSFAVASPIPSVPPVMTAVLPSSFLVIAFLLSALGLRCDPHGFVKQIHHEELEDGDKERPSAFPKIMPIQADSGIEHLHG